jgi:hypothetical protein
MVNVMHEFLTKMVRATFWAILSQTNLVTLLSHRIKNLAGKCLTTEHNAIRKRGDQDFRLEPGLPDFSWYKILKREKMYQIITNYTKWP